MLAPLKELLPGAKAALAGVSGIKLQPLCSCFRSWLLGWAIVQTKLGRTVKQSVEDNFMKQRPVFETYRRVTGYAVERLAAPAVQPAPGLRRGYVPR